MKILSAEQIRALDAHTIKSEPIASIDLMERASSIFTNWFIENYPNEDRPVCVFCGVGNNGGDGLAVSRLLHQQFYNIWVFWCKISKNLSEDFQTNLNRLPKHDAVPLVEISEGENWPSLPKNAIVLDAIFGSGLNRPVTGYWAELIDHLNRSEHTIVSIDIPSGLFADQHTSAVAIQAERTLSFQLPKLGFLYPENHDKVGEWDCRSIGLDLDFIQQMPSPYYYLNQEMIKPLLKKRNKYDHKGTYGHALLIMGSYGKIGAAVLAAKACLRSGVGLTTVHAPGCSFNILQGAVPEAMLSSDPNQKFFTVLPELKPFRAIGIGCGLDQKSQTIEALHQLIQKTAVPLVIDADALNILAKNKNWYSLLPKNSILTPHPKEFERLFGPTKNHFARNELQRKKARELGIYIILKGAHSCIATPEGNCYFNSTGNPGMGTGGSGDVLTGFITGLLAQSYSPLKASILGVFLHGLAGDLAAQRVGQEALIAGDLIGFLGKAFDEIKK